MELRHLRYFIAVAEEENVTRAAVRLNVSQPPLSRQIHDLEEELGVELFERTGKSLKLTDAGRVFLVEAKAALQRVEEAVQAVRAVAHGKTGKLNLGYAPSPTVGILPAVLKALRERFPGIRLNLFDFSSSEIIEGLRDRTLDAALMVEPLNRSARGITFEKIRSYPFVVAVAPGHPFAKKRSVKIEEVLREPIVALSRKEYPDYHELLEQALNIKKKQLRIVEECDSGMSLIAAIESGRGISIASSSLSCTAGERLKYVPLTPVSSRAVSVGLAYCKDALTRPERVFIETIRSAAITADE